MDLKIYLLTSNKGKIREITSLLLKFNISIEIVKGEKIEIQSIDLKKIVKGALQKQINTSAAPLLIEDSGLFIKSLNGFPGPYSSFVYKTIGLNGILELMRGKTVRKAKFMSVTGVYDPKFGIKTFEGIVEGKITERVRGQGGFGFDPIFIPSSGDGKTYAEMMLEQKNRCSHRAFSIKKLATWLTRWKNKIN